jgi:hypothetical protein
MIITGVETVPPRIPFRAGTQSDDSAWGDSNLPAVDSLQVRVTTDQGLTGWGEAFGFRAVASAKLAVDQLIAPLCTGQDASQIETLMSGVRRSFMCSDVVGLSPSVSLRLISRCGISQERQRICQFARCSAAVEPIWHAMPASLVTPMPHWCETRCGGQP